MSEPHPQRSQHGGIRQIPLPPTNRQLIRQMVHVGVGESDISLAVLEVNRVHFVGHGRRPHLARDRLLFEKPEGNIRPDVPVEVQKNVIIPLLYSVRKESKKKKKLT